MANRRQLSTELQPLVTSFDGQPWDWTAQAIVHRTPRKNEACRRNAAMDLSFIPLRPEPVVEVRDNSMEGERFC
jgi:hypothetical protein